MSYLKRNITITACAILLLQNISCRKQDDFLSVSPNIALSIPNTADDVQKLLNNESIFNRNDPALGAATAEDYFVTDASLLTALPYLKNTYLFLPDIYGGLANGSSDWSNPYSAIYIANVALEGIANLKETAKDNVSVLNALKGQALFYRSWQYYNLLQTFALPFDSNTSKTDLGVPIRLTSDFNVKISRATVEECYVQIIKDFTESSALLPDVSAYKTRPTSIAANAALARIYLAIGKYDLALKYSDLVLKKYNTLLDFNSFPATNFPISRTFVSEDIFHSTLLNYSFIFYSADSNVDSSIIALYSDSDLRKAVYFTKRSTGNTTFKGTYDYNRSSYSGLATDEMYLIRAECYVREGNVTSAMEDLNSLLLKRWKKGTFIPLNLTNADDALRLILLERRKELFWRGLRWTDLRRLNKEEKFKTTLTRSSGNMIYTLPPNDPRYAMPIPEVEGLPQNKR